MKQVELLEIGRILRQYLPASFESFDIQERQDMSMSDNLDSFYIQRQQRYQYFTEQLDGMSARLKPRYPELLNVDATPEERKKAIGFLRMLVRDVFVAPIHTLDFTLELYNRRRLVNKVENEGIYNYLMSIAGWNDGIERDNHNFGFHFHHVDTKKNPVRTNVLITFNPVEQVGPPDTLYWECHGRSYKPANPLRWSPKRCVAIHTAARPSVLNPGKREFRTPSRTAQILCCR